MQQTQSVPDLWRIWSLCNFWIHPTPLPLPSLLVTSSSLNLYPKGRDQADVETLRFRLDEMNAEVHFLFVVAAVQLNILTLKGPVFV